MTKSVAKTYADFALPLSLVSRADLERLVLEFERVDNELTAADARHKLGAHKHFVPAMSEALEDFLETNNLEIEGTREREGLRRQLRLLKDKVPVIHMTFAVTADPESLERLARWFRESIHPQVVIATHLQPSLIAGVYLRTPNHVHDFSLRGALAGKHGLLVNELEALRHAS